MFILAPLAGTRYRLWTFERIWHEPGLQAVHGVELWEQNQAHVCRLWKPGSWPLLRDSPRLSLLQRLWHTWAANGLGSAWNAVPTFFPGPNETMGRWERGSTPVLCYDLWHYIWFLRKAEPGGSDLGAGGRIRFAVFTARCDYAETEVPCCDWVYYLLTTVQLF